MPLAMLANTLLGNAVDAAGIEVAIALRHSIPTSDMVCTKWRRFQCQHRWQSGISAGAIRQRLIKVLTLFGPSRESRAYLALQGGIDVP